MTSITVTNSSALNAALKTAHAGDTILLASGTYSGISVNNEQMASAVTIKSLDLSHQAVVTDLNVTNSKGFAFSGLEFSRDNTADQYAYRVDKSANVTFSNLNVHGTDAATVANAKTAFLITNSSNIGISGSEFQKLANGVVFSDDTNLTFANNSFHNIGIGGIRGAAASNVQVTGNFFTDFHVTDGNHPDAIQFFTAGTTTASHDILVQGNVYVRGNGDPIQGIFFRDTVGGLTYSNVTVKDNLVVGSMYNGILVEDAKSVTVTGNTVVSFQDMAARLNLDTVSNVTETNNVSPLYLETAVTGLVKTGNTANAIATDGGKGALHNWLAAHPGVTAPTGFLSGSVSDGTTPAGGAGAAGGGATPGASTASTTFTVAAGQTSATLTGKVITLIGNDLGDSLTGNAENNTVIGGAGNDTLDGGGGADVLKGGAGNDTYILPNASTQVVEAAGGGIDTVIAKGNYVLGANVENLVINNTVDNGWSGTGNELNNVITGNKGANELNGAAGNDTINGGDGTDTISGGTGNDLLTGGGGADQFVFAPGGGHDVITDFGFGGHDVINISAYLKAGLNPTLHDVGANTVISFGNGEDITLTGVHASSLHSTTLGFIS